MLSSEKEKTNITWPNGARIAVLFSFDTQGQVGHQHYPHANGKTNFHELKLREYGGRVGIWRILDILDEYEIKGTFPTCGRTAELYPEAVKEIAKRGHEVAAHAFMHEKLYTLNRDEEREVMTKTIAALEKVTGIRPVGWRSPWYWSTENTISLNIDLGFRWNSDYHDDDVPYVIEDGQRKILEIPPAHDDWRLYMEQPYAGRLLLDSHKDEFDLLYKESAKNPKRFTLTYHPCIGGRPDRAKHMSELLRYIKGFPDIWFARYIDVADWWAKNKF